jgi:DNA helicase-2/ATP-dependent DNA helicase PcrA
MLNTLSTDTDTTDELLRHLPCPAIAVPSRRGGSVGTVPDFEDVLAGLNDAQGQAALAVRGPVAILAGAGTGKTTTITHRIACQVRSGAFEPSQILAVTFTDKAAGELRARLAALGVEGVEARTFHSAALSQLSRLWSSHTGEALPEVLDHKAPLIASLANALPPPHRFLLRRELAGEIECRPRGPLALRRVYRRRVPGTS